MLNDAVAEELIPSTPCVLKDELQAAGIAADLQIVDTDLHGGELRPLTTSAFQEWLHRYADARATEG